MDVHPPTNYVLYHNYNNNARKVTKVLKADYFMRKREKGGVMFMKSAYVSAEM